MKLKTTPIAVIAVACLAPAFAAQAPARGWKVHDMARPRPPVVTPPAQRLPQPPPPDAELLFDGRDLREWSSDAGGPAEWSVRDGVLTVVPGKGLIRSRKAFGDLQLHLEWAAPLPASGTSQGRGNSGIHLMGLYEVQILDSFMNETYADGQAGAIYGQYPPLVNASRPPGEWQSYDIFFRAPRFNSAGKLLKAARVTVVHNGVLVQDNVEILGPTTWLQRQPYSRHAAKLPLTLQEHGNPMRFRNIWVRGLKETPPPAPSAPPLKPTLKLDAAALSRYTGPYTAQMSSGPNPVTITRKGASLWLALPRRSDLIELVPRTREEFVLPATDARARFVLDPAGRAIGFAFIVAGDRAFTAVKTK